MLGAGMCESVYKHFKGRDLVYRRPTDVLDVCPAGLQNQMLWGTQLGCLMWVPMLAVGFIENLCLSLSYLLLCIPPPPEDIVP